MRARGFGIRRKPAPAIERVAAVAQRLAVLLAAGVPPAAAWGYLAEEDSAVEKDVGANGDRTSARAAGQPAEVIMAVADAAARGVDIAGAMIVASAGRHEHQQDDERAPLRPRKRSRRNTRTRRDRPASDSPSRHAWAALAAAWFVASEAGAPLAGSLRVLAESFRSLGQAERDIRVALAGPRATARVVIALPAVGILFGLAMGFDSLHVLLATAPGLVCLVLGVLLLAAGARWNHALVARARPADTAPGLALDLLAVAMNGGVSVERARALVGEAERRFGCALGDAAAADGVLRLAVRAGVPAAELLRSEAEQRRREARSDTQHDASALAVTLMLPLGCCVLPSFLLLGVAPVLVAIVSSTVGSVL